MMTNEQFNIAHMRFSERIDGLDHDIARCFWNITQPGAPGCAFFPAVMYAFATVDYFSSYWAGWNESSPGKNQTERLTAFMNQYLLYPRKEAQIAINFWRHKLMHTAEPRLLRNKENDEVYIWSIGTNLVNHMILVQTGVPNQFLLEFNPSTLVFDLREGVFGPCGYFTDLQTSIDLQDKYLKCLSEMENYTIKIKP